MLGASKTRCRSGRPRVQLLQFFLEAPELTSSPVDASLEAGYVCSQLQAWGEKRNVTMVCYMEPAGTVGVSGLSGLYNVPKMV